MYSLLTTANSKAAYFSSDGLEPVQRYFRFPIFFVILAILQYVKPQNILDFGFSD